MSTTAAEAREESHLSREEVEQLAHPKRPLQGQRIGVIASYVGNGRHRPLLHHPVLLDDRLLAAAPDRRAEHRVHPEPGVDRELQGRVLGTEQLRPLTDQLGDRVRHHDHPRPCCSASSAAYALARLRFRGKGAVLWLIMACSMFPLVVLLPPLLKMFSSTSPVHLVPVLD